MNEDRKGVVATPALIRNDTQITICVETDETTHTLLAGQQIELDLTKVKRWYSHLYASKHEEE